MTQQVLCKYPDGSYYRFAHGCFDDYMVVFCQAHHRPVALRDAACLGRLAQLGDLAGNQVVYHFFAIAFELVTANVAQAPTGPAVSRPADLKVLKRLSNYFADLSDDARYQPLAVKKLFDYFYFAMLAECYHPYTQLYHRIKRLAVYQVLILGMSAADASVFSRGRSVAELDRIMTGYHI